MLPRSVLRSASSSGIGPRAMRSASVSPSRVREPGTGVSEFLQSVNPDNVRKTQRGKNLCLPSEPANSHGIAGNSSGQDLDGDLTLQLGVPRAIYLTAKR